MRATSGLWVAAFVRRSNGMGVPAFIVRRGAEEAGAIFIKCNTLDGLADLYGPAPQSLVDTDEALDRQFEKLLGKTAEAEVDGKLRSETSFDPDIWIVEIEDKSGAPLIEIVQSH